MACCRPPAVLPVAFPNDERMFGVLADDEPRLSVLTALENRSRAEMPVGYPQLSRAGPVQQRLGKIRTPVRSLS